MNFIIGTGTDIIEVNRIRKLHLKYKNRFLNRVFHPKEINYCLEQPNSYTSFAARFALKEAFIKALNLSNKQSIRLSYKDIFLKGKKKGKKEIKIKKQIAKILLKKYPKFQVQFSISHTQYYATAFVIITKLKHE